MALAGIAVFFGNTAIPAFFIPAVSCRFLHLLRRNLRRFLEVVFGHLRELCRPKGVELLEGHSMPDHIHMCLSIPPKYSVAHTLGFLNGKRAVRIHRELMGQRRMTGLHFWSTGYWVSTVGADAEKIKKYISGQEQLESGQGDLDLK